MRCGWKRAFLWTLAALVLLVGGRRADAASITVNAGGGGDYTTIQAAINAAASGDVIVVAPGTYNENLVLAKQLTLQGAQAGQCAVGRITGTPSSATESIITGTSGTLLLLQAGCADSVIDGFVFLGGTQGIQSSSGPIHRVHVLDNHFEGSSGSEIFLNDPGDDITVSCNVFDGGNIASGGTLHLDQDAFDGFQLLDNEIRNGQTGLFCDGTRNVGSSTARNPEIRGNRFEGNVTGANLGRKAFEFATITDNVFANNSVPGLQGGMSNCTITDNWFVGNGRGALELTGFGGGTDATRGAQYNYISGNFFTGNGFAYSSAAVVFSSSQFPGTIATNVFVDNHVCGNYQGASYTGTETIDVTNNVWGHATGPLHTTRNPGGLGDEVVDNGGGAAGELTFDPWTTDFSGSPCAPQITCPADQTLVCDAGGAAGTFSFGVTDARGQAVDVTFDVDGSPAGSDVVAAGGPPTVGTATLTHSFSGTGIYLVTATATNTSGASTSCSFNVEVIDTTPPTVSCNATASLLWPARNGMMGVGLNVVALDGCDPNPAVSVTVYSDEAVGSAPYAPDAQVVGSSLRLRMERAYPGGNGRVYLIVVTATDASGNSATSCCSVVVPVMPVGMWILAVRAEAAAAEATCASTGLPPSGWSTILAPTPLP